MIVIEAFQHTKGSRDTPPVHPTPPPRRSEPSRRSIRLDRRTERIVITDSPTRAQTPLQKATFWSANQQASVDPTVGPSMDSSPDLLGRHQGRAPRRKAYSAAGCKRHFPSRGGPGRRPRARRRGRRGARRAICAWLSVVCGPPHVEVFASASSGSPGRGAVWAPGSSPRPSGGRTGSSARPGRRACRDPRGRACRRARRRGAARGSRLPRDPPFPADPGRLRRRPAGPERAGRHPHRPVRPRALHGRRVRRAP